MKKSRDGRRRFSREFKIAAVRRIIDGERAGDVARDLGLKYQVLWNWHRRVLEKGEAYLYEYGRPNQWQPRGPRPEGKPSEASQQRRMAELERLVGRQQLEIRFLDKALRRLEDRRPKKNDDGGEASSK